MGGNGKGEAIEEVNFPGLGFVEICHPFVGLSTISFKGKDPLKPTETTKCFQPIPHSMISYFIQ